MFQPGRVLWISSRAGTTAKNGEQKIDEREREILYNSIEFLNLPNPELTLPP